MTTTTTLPPAVSFTLSPESIDDRPIWQHDLRPTLRWAVAPEAGFAVTVSGTDESTCGVAGQPFKNHPAGRHPPGVPGPAGARARRHRRRPLGRHPHEDLVVRGAGDVVIAHETLTLTVVRADAGGG